MAGFTSNPRERNTEIMTQTTTSIQVPTVVEATATVCDCCKGDSTLLRLSCGHTRVHFGYQSPEDREWFQGREWHCEKCAP